MPKLAADQGQDTTFSLGVSPESSILLSVFQALSKANTTNHNHRFSVCSESKSKKIKSVKVDMPKIKNNIRILCLVLTSPANHERKAYKVFDSWGKRCTFIRFLTTQEDPVLPTIISPTEEIYDNLWLKTKLAI